MNESRSILLVVVAAVVTAALCPATSRGHDTWVQTASRVVPPGEVVHVDLALGNHGNEHRDFKFAGKLASLEGGLLEVRGPQDRRTDLVPDLVDLGYAPKEGFWSARFVTAAEGLHCVAHTLDRLHGTKRTVKSAKAYFLVARSPVTEAAAGETFAAPLGHALELVPETHPVRGCGPGKAVKVRILFRGRPLADERVSFIPRGAELKGAFDPEFERRTDAEGRASYVPKEGNYVLVVAHRTADDERGEGYDKTAYSATLVLTIPQRCDCCDD
ncbi:MAG: DUF4198 domain-containing protein [Planctomycetia bacterium]